MSVEQQNSEHTNYLESWKKLGVLTYSLILTSELKHILSLNEKQH